MGLWDLYFITKLFLYFGQYMDFHVWPNLALAIFLIIPISDSIKYARRIKQARQAIAIPLGIALFYYDTWFPPIARALSQTSMVGGFSLTYLQELLGRFFNPWVAAGLLLVFAIYYFAAKRIRVSSVIFVAMLAPMFSIGQGTPRTDDFATTATQPAVADTNANLSSQLSAFYAEEKQRSVTFMAPPAQDAPFDIIVLQVCSLSWDDLDFTKQRDNPLFKRFDVVFTNFNSAASYSGPAAIRLLRGSCGQPRHKTLYDPPSSQCLTFEDLKGVGFKEQLVMNHDGRYGSFLEDVRVRGGLQAEPFDTKGLPTYLQSFDGSPVHTDWDVLSKWWAARTKSSTPRVAMYYNTVSLHDGNYYPGRRTTSLEIYPPRLEKLLKDMDRFFSVLQASGRRAVVVFVAEHGASVRGDKMQIAGMREIPSPRITTVPLGIKLIGLPDKPGAQPLLIDKPTSYLALSQLLSNFITVSPFGNSSLSMKDYTQDLPETRFVSENEDTVVIRSGKRFFIRSKGQWIDYDPSP